MKIVGCFHGFDEAASVCRTVRVQTVTEDTNPQFGRLLEAFKPGSGAPISLTTLCNNRGEALFCWPRSARGRLYCTGIDARAICSFLLKKPRTPMELKPDEPLQ